jgi:recombination-promoting nuclease RpnB
MTIAELLKKEGQDQGRKEGRVEGRKEGRVEVAMTMLSKGLDWAAITDFTGLTHDELALIASKAS